LNVANGDLPPSLQQQYASGPSVSFLAVTINFATGSSNLAGNDNTHLKEVGALFKDFGGMLKVVGHASSRTRDLDPQTRQLANFNVSLERANAVANALMRQGVPADKVQVVAMADNEPLSHEYMPAGERENQRADVYIEY
jgi:outer membrane protein OmpA-like peptidoglycan-associated protein